MVSLYRFKPQKRPTSILTEQLQLVADFLKKKTGKEVRRNSKSPGSISLSHRRTPYLPRTLIDVWRTFQCSRAVPDCFTSAYVGTKSPKCSLANIINFIVLNVWGRTFSHLINISIATTKVNTFAWKTEGVSICLVEVK